MKSHKSEPAERWACFLGLTCRVHARDDFFGAKAYISEAAELWVSRRACYAGT